MDVPGNPLIHVVAGVLTDARGRILLARRTAGRDLAGAWEFPGGKVDPGETPFQALDRELHEELGIRIHSMDALITVAQAYANKRILLDVYRISRFSGKPRGCEKQALAWSPPEKLSTYPMPPADRPVVAALTQPEQYLVTPPQFASTSRFLQSLEQALLGGIRRVQFRVELADSKKMSSLALEAKRLCDQSSAQLLINGNIELARSLDCGVHLNAAQLKSLQARPLEPGSLVAASCHDRQELELAQALGVDFVVLGPVAKTPTHPDATPLGWQAFARLRECVALPIYAIGGMHSSDQATARRNGAQGIAAIRSLWLD